MKKDTNYYRVNKDVLFHPFSENSYDEHELAGEWEYPTYIYKNSIVKELPDFFGGGDGIKVEVLHSPTMEDRGFSAGETAETERRGAYINSKYLLPLTETRDLQTCEMLDTINSKSFEWFKDFILGEDELEYIK